VPPAVCRSPRAAVAAAALALGLAACLTSCSAGSKTRRGGASGPYVVSGDVGGAGAGVATLGRPGARPGVRADTDGSAPAAGPPWTPSVAPADAYEERNEPSTPGSPLAAAAFEALRDYYARTGRTAPLYDHRLEEAANEYARVFPEEGAPARDLADFVLRHVGIAEPFPHIAVYSVPELDAAPFAAGFAEDLPGFIGDRRNLRFAVGTAPSPGGGFRVIVAFLPGAVLLDEVPRAVKSSPKAAVSLRGRLLDSTFSAPHVVVTRPDGSVDTLRDVALPGDARAFAARVPLADGPGRYEIEVVAEGTLGPAVVALLPVWAGVAPPASIALRPGSGDGPLEPADAAERTLLGLVNDARRTAGLPPVAWSDAAAAVARAHSADMADHAFLGHTSPTSGTPEDRAAAAHLRHSVVEENVAKAYTPADAHDGLMASPGHRAVVLSRGATHVGIGVELRARAGEPPAYYVTELFLRDAPPVTPAAGAAGLATLVNDARRKAGLAPLKLDARLSALAAKGCEEHMERGRTPAETSAAVGAGFGATSADYRAIATILSVVPYLETILGSPEILDKGFVAFGTGAYEGKHPVEGSGVCIMVLLASPRK
jgi:uncharacterized protein YkwD